MIEKIWHPTNTRTNQKLIDSDSNDDNLINHFTKFKNVKTEDVVDIIKSLPNKQCELDPIPCEILKKFVLVIAPKLTTIINLSFRHGIYPQILKSSVITPIVKSLKDDTDSFANYRPVSGLSIF